MKKIVLASNNEHKVKEFEKMLKGYKILSLKDIDFFDEIDETGDTFFDNAFIKAKEVADYLKKNHINYDVIADDSGLCCNALNGAPGIYSARYAEDHNDQANRDKLRKELEKHEDHSAYFQCWIVLYHSDGSYESFDGRTYGVIIEEEKGSKEFGYDCIFLSDDLGKTFGEATSDEKNSVSHRSRAILKLKEVL